MTLFIFCFVLFTFCWAKPLCFPQQISLNGLFIFFPFLSVSGYSPTFRKGYSVGRSCFIGSDLTPTCFLHSIYYKALKSSQNLILSNYYKKKKTLTENKQCYLMFNSFKKEKFSTYTKY